MSASRALVYRLEERMRMDFKGNFRDTIKNKPPAVQKQFNAWIAKCKSSAIRYPEVYLQLQDSIQKIVSCYINSPHFASKAQKENGQSEMKAFKLLLEKIDVNMLLAIACHEAAWKGSYAEKIKYFHESIEKYGELFLVARPSKNDSLFSGGIFQLTDAAVMEAYALAKKIGITVPKKLEDCTDFKTYSELMVLNTIINLGTLIKKSKAGDGSNLQKIIDLMELSSVESKYEFIASVIGILHHKPKDYERVLSFIRDWEKEGNLIKQALEHDAFSEKSVRDYMANVVGIYTKLNNYHKEIDYKKLVPTFAKKEN